MSNLEKGVSGRKIIALFAAVPAITITALYIGILLFYGNGPGLPAADVDDLSYPVFAPSSATWKFSHIIIRNEGSKKLLQFTLSQGNQLLTVLEQRSTGEAGTSRTKNPVILVTSPSLLQLHYEYTLVSVTSHRPFSSKGWKALASKFMYVSHS